MYVVRSKQKSFVVIHEQYPILFLWIFQRSKGNNTSILTGSEIECVHRIKPKQKSKIYKPLTTLYSILSINLTFFIHNGYLTIL